jgi:2-iminobutanoate/2-iminopropanoate deaminase
MHRNVFNSARAPRPDGSYSSGVSAGPLVVVSAQPPLNVDGSLVGGEAAAQARQCLENVAHQLRSQGLGLESVVELLVYAVDPDDLAAIDGAIGDAFAEPRPARTVVGVAWVPHGARLQVGALAVRYP